MTEIDNEFRNENFVCPHCGYEFSDCFEWPEYGHEECHECKKEFIFQREIMVYYSTHKMDE